ncbi:DUF1835 domain-containing protein [Haloimpatiens massiliensis]|uniref:DUF1835 domain-containing protein n=1 Tax=Haloimpatiens massiliensis TaxID=1658110 RepID=UPI000C846068|nr:DUF1835 domain-containing protein [Haloimpatiens massiliensis]
MKKIIHVCFSESTRASLKYALSTKIIQGNKVIGFFDDLSSGPIYGEVKLGYRINWWKKIIKEHDIDYIEYLKGNYYEFNKNISKMTSTDTIYFWIGNNALDLLSLMFTLEKINITLDNMYIVNVSEITFNKGLVNEFTPRCPGEIDPKRFSDFLSIKRKMENKPYKFILNNWNRIKEEEGNLRVYQDGEIVTVDEDYFDALILKYTSNEFTKSARVVGSTLGFSKDFISDSYIFWRIQELIKKGTIEYRGNFNIMREMEVRISKNYKIRLC